ncbi:hypothetical protein Fmac_002203 [Flemingia macrophylla]|uniref:Uncharacterized protein n=1 Tax=Flemingia macrophylla TaxID=520843 RepID=A0ABD1NK16_9FABA
MVDTAKFPNSLEVMFNSSESKENLFQQLLAEGVFDITLLREKPEDCKTSKRLALSNLSTSRWTIMWRPKTAITKVGCEGREAAEHEGCYGAKCLFALPPATSLMVNSLNFVDESTDYDLLLSNTYFPEAKLLHPTLTLGAQASTDNNSVYSHLGHR